MLNTTLLKLDDDAVISEAQAKLVPVYRIFEYLCEYFLGIMFIFVFAVKLNYKYHSYFICSRLGL